MPVMSAKQPGTFPHVCVSSDKASHVMKHLQNSQHCRTLCSVDCFHILDHASTSFQLKKKEAFHIQREQPSLNHSNLWLCSAGLSFNGAAFQSTLTQLISHQSSETLKESNPAGLGCSKAG